MFSSPHFQVKISECPSSGFLAVLYLNKLVVLHSLCDVKNSLSVDRVLRLGELIPNGIMRSISVTQNEIFVGTFNGIKGLFVINIWEGEEESKEEPMRLNEDLDWMY